MSNEKRLTDAGAINRLIIRYHKMGLKIKQIELQKKVISDRLNQWMIDTDTDEYEHDGAKALMVETSRSKVDMEKLKKEVGEVVIKKYTTIKTSKSVRLTYRDDQ